ncbi:MAG: hypothetical protein GEU92_02145 [Alphaproteobacteria bacterium]|nr:hypothetical protein [Alphaproteobacteria bacterium]
MEKAVRSSLNRLGPAVVLALFAAACSRAAPELPPDITSVEGRNDNTPAAYQEAELALSCEEIDARLFEISQAMDELEGTVAGNRRKNQTIGYIGAVLFMPLMLAAEENAAEKKALDDHQGTRDRLFGLRAMKRCPLRSDPRTGRIPRK